MPQIYEVWNLDRYNAGLKPYKYSGSNYNDNPLYLGSSKHPDYKNHCQGANLKKYCLLSFSKNQITTDQLRKLESMIQVKEDHAGSEDYYNMTNTGQPDPNNPITRKKISDTCKSKGMQPSKLAIAKAHTKSSQDKRLIKRKGYKWFHNPSTSESLTCLPENCPDGFISGKCVKKIYPPKKTKDQIEFNNTQSWKIYKDEVLFWEGKNLKEYCRNNIDLKWMFSKPDLTVRVKNYAEHSVYKIDGVIYLDNIIFNGTQKELCQLLGLSESNISTAINKTNKVRCISSESVFTATRVK